MKNVYLISCTKNKQRYSCTAEEMYQPSAFFSAALQYGLQRVESKNDQIHILSSTYGLLYLTDRINTYDESLTTKSDSELQLWGQKVIKYIGRKHDLENTNFIFLAEREYVDPIVPHLKHYETPLDGMDLAQSTSWLQKNSKKIAASFNCLAETQEKKMERIEPSMLSNKTDNPILTPWNHICELFSSPTEIQTVTQNGEPGIWISIFRMGKELFVEPAKYHEPKSLMAKRVILQKDFEEIAPLYQRWREGNVSRLRIAEMTQNSSYIFAIIHHLLSNESERLEVINETMLPVNKVHRSINEDSYTDCLVCKPSGYLLSAYGYDAYVLNRLLGYQLIPDKNLLFKTGFPYSGIEKVTQKLSSHQINHCFLSKDKEILNQQFENNNYNMFASDYKLASERDDNPASENPRSQERDQIDKNANTIGLFSRFSVRDCKSNEVITKTILPSYEIVEINKHGGAYYGAGYKSKIVSDADPIENNTISDEAPLAKSLLGHKVGETIIHSRGNGDIDLYLIEEVENQGTLHRIPVETKIDAEPLKIKQHIPITSKTKELIQQRKQKRADIPISQTNIMPKEPLNEKPIQQKNEDVIDEAMMNVKSLIDIMMKMEINEEHTRHMKALIDLRLFLGNK